jgi:acetyltransferase
MGIHNLEKIFRPDSIAVVGASEKEGSIGRALLGNLRTGGFAGDIFPVNPHYKAIDGREVYPSLTAIGKTPELVAVAAPIAYVPAIVKEAAGLGVGGVVVISAGGKEAGVQGEKIERAIMESAGKSGLRIIGPNCLGVVCTEKKLNASFAGHMPLPGKLAFISQSGAICSAILDLSLKEQIGFSHFVSIGSMLDVDFGDLIDYLGNESAVDSILLYIESLTNLRKFMSAARAVSRIKPILALKAGRSSAGARAASSHTGALAGEDAVYEAAFQRAGIVRVTTIEDLFDCAELLAKQPRPSSPGLAIITNAGGPGVMATDALAEYGLEPVALSQETFRKLNSFLPPSWSRGNPIDMLGDASADRYRKVVEICLNDKELDGLLLLTAPQAMTDPTAIAASVIEVLKGSHRPVFTSWMGGRDVEKGRELFNRAGIPTYDTPERAIRAFQYMVRYDRNQKLLQETPSKLPKALQYDQVRARNLIQEALGKKISLLTEFESKKVLQSYGIPINRTELAFTVEEALKKAGEIGYPVAMKIHSREISHKSDVHGVQLNLVHEEDVRAAFEGLIKNILFYKPEAKALGVTIQAMLRRPDYELILGSKRDPDFGPVILFGMGGIMTEVLKDYAIALPPLNRLLARRLIEGTRVYELLKGYRNRPPANLTLLEEILVRLSQLVTDLPEIRELDINPVILLEDQACAVDVRIRIETGTIPSPLHLVISPYPNQYESTLVTGSGIRVLIRPIKPEDAPLMAGLFETLSPQSIYFRFFSPLKSIPSHLMARFTQIDYDREMALVAIEKVDDRERMLGVGRLTGNPDGSEAEFAVLVGDPWQGKGIGAALLEKCIAIARERGLKFLWGLVLPQNTTMLALGRKLGFQVGRSAGGTEYELRIDLDKLVKPD